MPKRINNIFDSKFKVKYFLSAYERASKLKHDNKEIILFEMNLGTNIYNIMQELYTNNYRMGIYRKFMIYDPKKREIMSLPFRDRVIHQWYVEEFIKPIFLPQLIEDTYACIEGRGVHKAIKKLHKYMQIKYKRNREYYIVKCDISKFFYNIDKEILYNIIKRKIKDEKFLKLTKKLIFDGTGKVKIPIGNYTSQWFANIYLNELDHFIKEELKIKFYVRYMDDFALLTDSKEESKYVLRKIKQFLYDNLKLTFNKKTTYFKNKQGVNFCGYKIKDNKIYISKSNKKKMYKKIKKWNELYEAKKLNLKETYVRLEAWRGHASHCTSQNIINSMIHKCDWIYF